MRMSDRAIQRCRESDVGFVAQRDDVVLETDEGGLGLVGASIVDHDDFVAIASERLIEERTKATTDEPVVVVGRHNDRDQSLVHEFVLSERCNECFTNTTRKVLGHVHEHR